MALGFNEIWQSAVNGTLMGNSVNDYISALAIFLVILVVLKFFGAYIVHLLKKIAKKTKTSWDDMTIDFMQRIKWPFYIYLSFYAATKTLSLPHYLNKAMNYLLVIFIGYYSIVGINKAISNLAEVEIEKRKQLKRNGASMIKVLSLIAKISVWVIALLMILSNLGVQITPLVASLGIGGIAVALALQTVLADLFSAFAIYFDKPFEEGDFVIIGTDMGIVEQIGIKTTRIRTLQGEQLVVSNSEMTSSRVHNYKRMQKRRVAFKFGVEYGTSTKKLKKINEMVKKIFKGIEMADLDRVHFREFGDFSLIYEVVYFLKTGDYNKYMDTQQQINFAIKDAFEKEKIAMAFPTQTINLKKQIK